MDDHATDRLLREALSSIQSQRGSCPDASSLLDFRNEKLDTNRTKAILDHMAVCGTCQLLVERLKAVPSYPRRWFVLNPFRSPVVGYAGCAIACLLAVHNMFGDKGKAPPPLLQSVFVKDLDVERGPRTLAPAAVGEFQLLLVFQLPIQSGRKYTASIMGPNHISGAAEVNSWDDRGNFCVLVDKRQLAPGSYHLSVTEVSPKGDSVRNFDFEFSL